MRQKPTATAALELLETLPPGPELAMAYSNLAQLRMLDHDLEGTLLWGKRAIALAEQFDETETLIHALTNVGSAHYLFENPQGEEELARSVPSRPGQPVVRPCRPGIDEPGFLVPVGRCSSTRPSAASPPPWPSPASTISTFAAAISWRPERHSAFARGTGRPPRRRSMSCFGQPESSPVTRIIALTTLGRVRARRGDPKAGEALDEALALAEQTGALMRLGPVRAARAEAALLAGETASEPGKKPGRARARLIAGQSLGTRRNRLAALASRRARSSRRRAGRTVRPADRGRLRRSGRCLARPRLPV